jgi:hypothetical protein
MDLHETSSCLKPKETVKNWKHEAKALENIYYVDMEGDEGQGGAKEEGGRPRLLFRDSI